MESEASAVRRIERAMLALGLAGSLAGTAVGGWRWGAGFLLGALASYLNFRWLKQLVYALSHAALSPGKPPRARVAVILGFRYLILAAGAYAIVNYSELSLTAALMGLFVSVAAVMLEILFELVYAGT
jgi:hypothetical protein